MIAKTALILLNGEKPSLHMLEEYWGKSDFKVCADGAAAICSEYKLQPELIIGDLDSLDIDVESEFPASEIVKMADQETTDGEKAIQYCIDQGYREISLIGALGKRVDHSLYNLGLLRKFYGQVDEMIVVSNDEIAYLITGEKTITAAPGTRISLLPVYGNVDHVTARGLVYPIENESLELGCHSSISNIFAGTEVYINATSGFLLIVIEEERSL